MRIHTLVADVLIALAQTGVAVLLGQESAAQGWPALDATGYLMVALVNAPVVLRGRAPVAVCLMVLVMWAVYVTAGYWPVVNSFAPMLAVYTVAATRSVRTAVGCAALMSAVWIYAGAISEDAVMVSVLGQAVGFSAVLVRFGYTARRSTELADRLREEQQERARREVADERGRIARELHDVVAHHMSVISVQVGLARFVCDTDPATARNALATIEESSRNGLEELRRVLRVLRVDGDGGPAAPMPGISRLDEMADRVRAGGVPVDLRVHGRPRPLPPGVELCAYRCVQEALTNVLKHAPGARTQVQLHYESDQLTVSITNGGQGVNPDKMRTGSGHGLIGMRERAKLYGGTVTVGPRSEGGFTVRLILPVSVRTSPKRDGTTE
ncbi:sensor histidine kinase [Streptomyces sp. NEAU-Y11]|uniref:sensor histidine kinase n=1 Tax=Streptomyces cucumeris TaxID=2962890 RepID=UPI0020C83763|nr:sensor histidine kinase [Streptomyces sp. NEAU-Y11]MCP9211386.1 sensor histidine kinase [Streptomyces sp. NEAU-Y11]